MLKKIFILVLFLFIWLTRILPVSAATYVAGASATLAYRKVEKLDLRAKRLTTFLSKYNSPLTVYAGEIVSLADEYHIDYRLVVAISGVESTFCKAIPYNSYNCWGWKNGKHAFRSYPDALEKVTKTLSLHYYNRGFDTPEAIGPIYAPPTPDWAWKVRFFMNLIDDDTQSTFLAKQFSI